MKRFIPFVFLVFAACRHEMPDIPHGVIPPEKMHLIMSDMLIADALAETRTIGAANEKQFTEQYYATIYKNYGITRSDFVKSYHFYEDNPVAMNLLYDEILGEISRREAAISGGDSTSKAAAKADPTATATGKIDSTRVKNNK
jgi:hypothetical protein